MGRFNYPNTLALVLANEIDNEANYKYMADIKAYARDLKAFMNTCNTHADSPTKGQMRNIPLMYAKQDAGDTQDEVFAKYMFCGGKTISIDIFGLNNERYCGIDGPNQYHKVNTWVTNSKFPGAFMHSEEGCSTNPYPHHTRDWAQIKGFFENYPAIDGFFGYTYYDGKPEWGMFDGPSATATIFQDGKNFFANVNSYGTEPADKGETPIVPDCEEAALVPGMFSVDSVEKYDTGKAGLPESCPLPYASDNELASSSESRISVAV